MLPNFLIVGAAKSGTTSIYYYLKQHPDIYMSPSKEPKFITAQFLKFPFKGIKDDIMESYIIKKFDDYRKLFENIHEEKAIGEASPDNLYYYKNAIKYIKEYFGDVKIIIILRNPVERAFSNYLHLKRDSREYLSFEEALNQEDERKKKNYSFIFFYKDIGFYYNQVKAYLENFKQVRIYLYDDLKKDALALMKDIFIFLEVDCLFKPDINVLYNPSGIPINRFMYEFLTKPHSVKNYIKPIVNPFLSAEKRGIIVEKLKREILKKPKMKPETRKYLINLYRDDILKLQDLINRDLSHWLK